MNEQRTPRHVSKLVLIGAIGMALPATGIEHLTYPIVDTAQVRCYDDRTETRFPRVGAAYFGQDAHYVGLQPSYRDNGDGTVTDQVTGLMWQQDPGGKMTLPQALAGAKACRTAGYSDWRMPSIKELYSLILFSGIDPDPMTFNTRDLKPFMDSSVFSFSYGDTRQGERIIDSQYASATLYVSTTMGGTPTMFGVNFADGRIKGYPAYRAHGRAKTYYVMYVRGNPEYGRNRFVAGAEGTVIDHATGLTWMRMDSGALNAGPRQDGTLNWQDALGWAEQLDYGGHTDWRLPNVKELQSIVDYSRSPATTGSAALGPLFTPTRIVDESGQPNYPFYWTSSTHARVHSGAAADYIAFGEALGWMQNRRTGTRTLMDVHGAGAQRSDPKSGSPDDTPYGRGPQGDVVRIFNYVLCVRGGTAKPQTSGPRIMTKPSHRQPSRPSGGRERGRARHRPGESR